MRNGRLTKWVAVASTLAFFAASASAGGGGGVDSGGTGIVPALLAWLGLL